MDELVGLLVRIHSVPLPLVMQLVPGHGHVIFEEAFSLLFGHRRNMREVVTLALILVSTVDQHLSFAHPHDAIDKVVLARCCEDIRLYAFRDLDP